MTSGYHMTVKKYLDQNRIEYPLPDYIQRGWKGIYTPEEKEFLQRSCIIAPDVQIPNSVVRACLGTNQTLRKANMELLHKALELPGELFQKLSHEHQRPEPVEDENLHFQWADDDDDELNRKRQKSPLTALIDKQREKRRKYEDYKYDYDNLEPLTMDEIIEEIRTNIGKDLKMEDIKLITELMQIIGRSKTDQIMNIFDEFSHVQLIDKFGGVPKLVEALQEIQKAFEQIAMKTNVASIETAIDVLREKDKTYRVAVELLNSFNENIKKNKQLNLNDKSGDISDHDHAVFDKLIKDRISRLPATDLKVLVRDFDGIRTVDTSQLNNDRDEQVKFVSEQLNIIFIRAHLDGIKTALNTMKSPVSVALREYIDRIERSLSTQLSEHDHIVIESYIQDHLASLTTNELETVHERLAQQGTLKRSIGFNELNQSITMGLTKKIATDGLATVIENIKEAHLDINSMNELVQALTQINQHIQKPTSISLEQIQNQLEMAYFVQTHDLSEQKIHQLAEAVEMYSIAHIPLSEEATKDECATFLEHLKGPFVRQCVQRILNSINEENPIDLSKVSNRFYNERIIDLINELTLGSDQLNQNLLFHQIKKQLKKNKDLPDKLYRQMLKGKSIQIEAKMKIDTDKKKITLINDGIHRIFNDKKEQNKQKELMELFDRSDIPLPDQVKNWYKNKPNIPNRQSIPPKVKKDNAKSQIKASVSKPKGRLPTTTAVSTTKSHDQQKRSSPKSQPKTQPERKHPEILDANKKPDQTSSGKEEKGKMRTKQPISIGLKLRDQRKNTLDAPLDEGTASPSTTSRTEPFDIDQVSKSQIESEENFIVPNTPPPHSTMEMGEGIDSSLLQPEKIQGKDDPQPSVHQPSNASLDTSTGVQLDTTTGIEKDFAISPRQENEIVRADLETIHLETTIDGKMGANKTINFELHQATACYFHHVLLPSDPEREINIQLVGKIAELINDPPYEKTKAQRILAKDIPTSASHSHLVGDANDTRSSPAKSTTNDVQPTSTSTDPTKSIDSVPQRTLNRSLKQTDDYYINSLTKLLQNLFTRSDDDSLKLRKIHEELIASGHISPLNEFYRSTNEALRVTLDHCVTYNELIAWTLSLLQTNNKPDLIDFGHDLYSIAIDLDSILTDRIDNTRCAMEIQENLKHQLQNISDNDLREINSYINAAQLEKTVHISKKLNVTSKDRMISDLNTLLLHLIQACHTFEPKYRPMQTRIREISETFKSRAVAGLARKIDEIEKHLSKTFSITLFGLSQRMNESRFQLIK